MDGPNRIKVGLSEHDGKFTPIYLEEETSLSLTGQGNNQGFDISIGQSFGPLPHFMPTFDLGKEEPMLNVFEPPQMSGFSLLPSLGMGLPFGLALPSPMELFPRMIEKNLRKHEEEIMDELGLDGIGGEILFDEKEYNRGPKIDEAQLETLILERLPMLKGGEIISIEKRGFKKMKGLMLTVQFEDANKERFLIDVSYRPRSNQLTVDKLSKK